VFGEWPAESTSTTKIFSGTARVTSCLGDDCGSLWTFGAGVAMATQYGTSSYQPMLDTSVQLGTGFVRPMAELTVLAGEVAFAGARFGGRHITVDAGVGKVFGDLTHTLGDTAMAMVGLGMRP
jgi:hypothetical protein